RAVSGIEIERHRILERGPLRDDVDRTAGGAAPEQRAGRSLENLHFLVVEAVADIGAEVAQPVEIHVVLGIEAADLELVPGKRAALADCDRDAGHVAKRAAETGDGLLLHLLAGDDADRLRRVLDGRGQYSQAGIVLLVVLVALVLDLERAEHHWLIGA